MRLASVVPSESTSKQIVSCYRCGARITLAGAVADLDGPSFRAYFCPNHLNAWVCGCGGLAELQPTGKDPSVMRCTSCGTEVRL